MKMKTLKNIKSKTSFYFKKTFKQKLHFCTSLIKLKDFLVIALFMLATNIAFSQNSELNYDGIVVPTLDRTTVIAPTQGQMVCDENTNTIWFYNGTTWIESSEGENPWSISGDNISYSAGDVTVFGNEFTDITNFGSFKTNHNILTTFPFFSSSNYYLNFDGRSIQSSFSNFLFTPSASNLGLNPLGGNVGIGTKNPVELLDLHFTGREGIKLTGDDTGDAFLQISNGGGNHFIFDDQSDGNTLDIQSANHLNFLTGGNVQRMRLTDDGRLGIGTTAPCVKLEIVGGSDATLLDGSGYLQVGSQNGANIIMDDNEIIARNNESTATLYLQNNGGQVRCGEDLSAQCVSIRGGCDITEGVNTVSEILEPGDVVVIDDMNPGNVKRTSVAYDRKVAGIISGANGINAGMNLSQEGVLEGDYPLAMIGQVYVKVTGKVKAGDMLTTSKVPGHAQAVKNFTKSPGAVIGKAMSSNKNGEAMVLVLVNLQ